MSEYPSAGNPDYRSGNGLTAQAHRQAMMEAEREAQYSSRTSVSTEQTIGRTPQRHTLSERLQEIQKQASDNLRIAQRIEYALYGTAAPNEPCDGAEVEYNIERRAAETLDDLQLTALTLGQIWERLGE